MIDVNFDFTTDTPGFWDDFGKDGLLGHSRHDPDNESKTLREYHKRLWSKQLPNGQILTLESVPTDYPTWQNFFSSTPLRYSFAWFLFQKLRLLKASKRPLAASSENAALVRPKNYRRSPRFLSAVMPSVFAAFFGATIFIKVKTVKWARRLKHAFT